MDSSENQTVDISNNYYILLIFIIYFSGELVGRKINHNGIISDYHQFKMGGYQTRSYKDAMPLQA